MRLQPTTAVALATLIAQVYGHGLVTGIKGSNGVTMPGLGNIDGTPRDCSTAGCGAEADVPVFSGNNNPLGKSEKGGVINAATEVAKFMGTAAGKGAAGNQGAGNQAGGDKGADKKAGDNKDAKNDAADAEKNGKAGANPNKGTKTKGNDPTDVNDPNLKPETATPIDGGAPVGAVAGGQNKNAKVIDARADQQAQDGLAQGTKTPQGTKEDAVAASAGQGGKSGLPTVGEDGVIDLQFHQVNADGAGPYTATIDPTSGGTQESAFKPAKMITNIPGTNGNDAQNTATDFNVQVQMPTGIKCSGTIAGQKNVCVVRIQNPRFGGSAVFQQAGTAGSGAADDDVVPSGGDNPKAPSPAKDAVDLTKNKDTPKPRDEKQGEDKGMDKDKGKSKDMKDSHKDKKKDKSKDMKAKDKYGDKDEKKDKNKHMKDQDKKKEKSKDMNDMDKNKDQGKDRGKNKKTDDQNANDKRAADGDENPTATSDPNLKPEAATPIRGGAPVGAVAGGRDANAQVIHAGKFLHRRARRARRRHPGSRRYSA